MNWKSSRIRVGFGFVLLLGTLAIVSACRQQEKQEPKSPESSIPSKVTVEQVQQWMKEGKPLAILDSRSAHAWDSATTEVAGAVRVAPNDIEPYLSEIPRDRRIVVYCT
jgi:hypothetical protein